VKLSICVTIKNRSLVIHNNKALTLFPNCIESLANSLSIKDDAELIITDWNSTDRPIKTWIEAAFPYYPIHLITINGNGFNRGKGRNIAAQYAQGEILFFLDADMLVDRELIVEAFEWIDLGYVFYPVPWYYTKEDRSEGNFNSGVGNMFIKKELFNKVGPWPEYDGWGFEDLDLFKKIKDNNIQIRVKETPNFIHQWHPQTKEFKNQYDKENKELIKSRQIFYQEQQQLEQQQLEKEIQLMLKKSLAHTNRI